MSEFTPEEKAEIRKLNSEIKVTTKDDKEPYMFISYKSDDRLMMLKIVHRLHTVYGLRVYYDKDFDVKNDLWVKQMENNMSSAKCYGMLAFFTKKYYMSYATCMEMMNSQTSQCYMTRKENQKEYLPIVPVNLEPRPIFGDEELDMDTGLQHDNREPNPEKSVFLEYYRELEESKRINLTYYKPQRSSFPLTVKDCSAIIKKIYDNANVNQNRFYQSDFDTFCNNLAKSIHSSIYKGMKKNKASVISVFDEEKYNKAIAGFKQTEMGNSKKPRVSENVTQKNESVKEQKVSEQISEKSNSVNNESVKNQQSKRIGDHIKECMRKLEKSNYHFSDEMFNDLLDKEATSKIFSLSYAFFVEDRNINKIRYWAEPFRFNEKTLYISSQWVDTGKQREKFDKWYASLNVPKEQEVFENVTKKSEHINNETVKSDRKDKVGDGIGDHVRNCMKKLETLGYRFSEKMLADMLDKDASKQIFSLGYSFFVEDRNDSNKNRYWAAPFTFNDRIFYITKEWFDKGKQREKFDEWYASLIVPKELISYETVSEQKNNGGKSDDCIYSLYGETYTDNQARMMQRVFEEVLKKHEDIVPQLPNYEGMNCVSFINYTLAENKSGKPSYFRPAKWLTFSTGNLCIGTSYSVEEKLRKIAILLMICNEPQNIISFEKYKLPTVPFPKLNK